MWGSPAFALLGTRKLAKPLPLYPAECKLYLDPAAMLVLGPWSLDYKGSLSLGGSKSMGFLPSDPSLSGARFYGQFAVVGGDPWNPGVYLSNGIHMQIPYMWAKGAGPDTATIVASGAGALTAVQGVVKKNFGLVFILSP